MQSTVSKREMSSLQSFFTNDRTMLALVLVNTLFIFVGGYFTSSRFFIWADSLFTLLFVTEIVVKLSAYGWKGYWKDGWNKFDFILTLIALPSLANLFADTGLVTHFLLSLRSLRVFKSFRLFKFIPNIESLLRGIKLAVKTSLIVCVAFLVLLFIVSIISTTLYGNIAPQYFGDPGISLFTIFRYFSGDDWATFPLVIGRETPDLVARLTRMGYAVLYFFGGVMGLSLVNSIFVDAMANDNNDELMAKLEELEKKLDKLNESR